MKRLGIILGIFSLSILASCDKETDEELKDINEEAFNYPVYIDISREGFHFYSVSTNQSFCGDYHEMTYAGMAKNFVTEGETTDDDVLKIRAYFEDTCICKTISRDNNICIIR